MQPDIFSLDGKTALVTGASSGLGHQIARVLAQAGAHVVVTARREEKLEQLVNEIETNGGKATAMKMDVTSSASVVDTYDRIEKEIALVDVLLNNAGVADTKLFISTLR